MTTAEDLAQRLGARAMPIEGKRKLAAVGNAMEKELDGADGVSARDGRVAGTCGGGVGVEDAVPDEPAAEDGGDL